MELVSSWELKGRQEGRQEGKGEIVLRLIRRRFGAVADAFTQRIDRLTSEQLNILAEDLLDFTSVADLEQWLIQRQSVAGA